MGTPSTAAAPVSAVASAVFILWLLCNVTVAKSTLKNDTSELKNNIHRRVQRSANSVSFNSDYLLGNDGPSLNRQRVADDDHDGLQQNSASFKHSREKWTKIAARSGLSRRYETDELDDSSSPNTQWNFKHLVRRALGSSSIIPSGSRISSNGQNIRPALTFQFPDYQATCNEDVPFGEALVTAQLANIPAKNGNVSEQRTPDLFVDNGNFSAHWDGNAVVIKTKGRLDADDNGGFYQFVVTARVSEPVEKATATVRVFTRNTNDEAPRFTQNIYMSSVDETAGPNTLVATVIATDKDGDKITYAFADGTTLHKVFQIDRQSGVIRLYNLGNKIEFPQNIYELNVTATDDGSCCPETVRNKHISTAVVTVIIKDVNDNKPVFDKCGEYTPHVKENEPLGTHIIRVSAVDADRGRNGEVVYSIVIQDNQQAKFKIDEKNGEVRTNKIFDREGEDGKLVPLTVKATDLGEPPLEGLCTLQVQIDDVNDNKPVFDRLLYSETINQNKNLGGTLFHVSASDLDSDQNAAIIYSLGPKTSQDAAHFSINPDSGRVTLSKLLGKQKFRFYVEATDKGQPPLSSRVDVELEVVNMDVAPPRWDAEYRQPVEVQENVTLNSVIETIRAVSGLPDNKKVIYKLMNGNTPQTNKKSTFLLRQETEGDKTIAKVVVNAQLDFEEINEYNLTIRAENAEKLSLASEMTLQIRLIDVNDEVPLFGKTEEGSVLENEPNGTKVFKITAHDRDGTAKFNTVYYSIVPGEGDDNFQIDRTTGQVSTKASFDREERPFYRVSVAAEDGAPSARPNSAGMPNINREIFKIRIDDKNDNWPKFSQTLYHAKVQENEDLQHSVITVTATDDDESSKIQYQLTTGNDGGAFAVNSDTGLIYVAGSIDYEALESNKKWFELTLVASDSLHEADTTVRIQVLDVNDLPPKFNTSTYEVSLVEEDGYNLPKKILQVFAQDGDKDRPQEIIYFLTGQGTEEPASFRVGRTSGEIEVLKPLDRDQPHGRPQWRFTVLAADEGGRNGTQYGYAEVKVNLKDINDNAPKFLEAAYEGKVPENTPPGQLALTMTAIDYDDPNEGTNAVLTYSIVKNVMNKSRPVFTIDPQNAEIKTAICCLDREATAKYTILIMAKDGGGKTGSGTATITIDDDNDSPPRFQQNVYRQEIDETFGNMIPAEPVLTVKVLDDDLPETNKNYFVVVKDSGVGWDRFTIVRSSTSSDEGLLKVRLPLDYENETHRKGFNFTILVDDSGGLSNDPSHMATAQVVITLRDINDNAPEFAESFINVSVKEDTKEDTIIAKFFATDKDNNGQSVVRYSLDRTTNRRRHFRILTDGSVKIHRPLDREENVTHTVKVLAIDDGKPSRTATATLLVNVLDINDNPPAFCEDYLGLVMEDGPDDLAQVMDMHGKPLEMEFCDPDDPEAGNGPPFRFKMDDSADNDIKQKFELRQKSGSNGQIATLYVRQKLDREDQKDYKIPVQIADSGSIPLTGTSTLTVIVGDINDHGMKDGSTDIEVYLFKGRSPAIVIGRVYSDDEDDWDWPEKTFRWEGEEHPQFILNATSGQITMKEKTREGTYILYFTVTDPHYSTVQANVTVRVINIPEEAVYKSGSIRIKGTSEEEFISIWDYKRKMIVPSKRELLQEKIAEVMGVKRQNVQIFTVMKSTSRGMLDVRFAVHGSPYYEPERLNGALSEHKEEIEKAVGIEIEMIGIDECLYENKNCEGSCNNDMIIYEKPYMITAKRTGMAGIHAFIEASCYCRARENFQRESCDPNPCFHDGECNMEHNGARCSCPAGYDGPRCQQTTRSFGGDGYAWFAPLKQCENSHLSLEFMTEHADGLLFYNGPITEPNPKTPIVQDFISLELISGRPKLLLDFGSGTVELYITQSPNLADGEWHRLDVVWNPDIARLIVDLCQAIASTTQDGNTPISDRSICETSGAPPGYHEYLNVNGPLQLGGVQHPILTNYQWGYPHGRINFKGCIRNLVHNSEVYNLASPEMLSKDSKPGCSHLEGICMANDLEQQCQHGTCSSSLVSGSRSCLCYPGYYGDQCQYETIPATFFNDSFVRYALKSDVGHFDHLFRSEIQLTYRARWTDAPILSVVGKGEEFMRVEIKNSGLRFSFNLNEKSREEQEVTLPYFIANDGYWHTVRIIRYGSYAALSVDGGEGKRYGETLLEDQGFNQLMRLNENQVVLGTHPEFGTPPEVKPSYNVKACFDDFRFDRHSYHLPMPPLEEDTSYGSVLDAEVDAGCNSSACVGISCPDLMECIDVFLIYECRCLPGYIQNEMGLCVDIDECEVLFPGPCQNGGTCVNNTPFYTCLCPDGFTGERCDVIQEKREVKLSMGALAAILVCVLVVLLLALVLIIYTRNRQTNYGPVDPDDDIRENIINYNDEGGGEDDTQTYDFGLLRIPIDPSGMPIGSKPGPEKPYKEPLQNRGYSPDDPDVGEFINSNLGKADDDPDALPMDDLRVYAYEGGGSDAGSLSSLASGTDDNEQDFDYLNGWGPRFQKLADMYGQGESEEE